MRMSYAALTTLFAATLLLANCANHPISSTQAAHNFINRQTVTPTSSEQYPARNPKNVTVFNEVKKPHAPYRVIGVAKISKYNVLGMKRHDHTLHSMMKNLAASMGGDGLINVNMREDNLEADIIAFQKILI